MTNCVTVMQYTRALQSWLLILHYSTEQGSNHELVQHPLDELPPSMSLSLQTLPGGDCTSLLQLALLVLIAW